MSRHSSKATPLIDRFFRYVGKKQPNGCIPWIGHKTPKGYGRIGSGRRREQVLRAHRVSYELFVQPIPRRFQVLHRCDNPSCINPAHLFLGLNSDNMKDKMKKNRSAKGTKITTAKLTEEKVREIRRRYSQGNITNQVLADEFRVTASVISEVVNRRAWKHVT